MKEFNIIKKYLRPLSKNNYGAINLTDDVYFDLKKNIAISIDTYIENKHFLFSSDLMKASHSSSVNTLPRLQKPSSLNCFILFFVSLSKLVSFVCSSLISNFNSFCHSNNCLALCLRSF